METRKPKGLDQDLRELIGDGQLVAASLKASQRVNNVELARLIIQKFPSLTGSERSLAIDTLVGRVQSAKSLISAVDHGTIASNAISAAQARVLSAHKNKELNAWLAREWGIVRKSPAARLAQIKQLEKALTPGELSRGDLAHGRALFRKTCSGCHRLFGDGRTTVSYTHLPLPTIYSV